MTNVRKLVKRTVIIIAIVLLLLPLTLYFLVQLPAVQLPAVQTMLVHSVTHSLQKQLPQSSISVGSVHYALFNKLVVNNIYASDIHGDTLLYVQTAAVNISRYRLTTRALTLSSVHLYDGVFNLYDGPKTNNINEVLRSIPATGAPPDTLSKASGLTLQVKDIAVTNFRFTYRNLRNPTTNPSSDVIDFKDLSLSRVNIGINNLRMTGDTVFFGIEHIDLCEKSGFRLRQLSAKQGYLCTNQVMLKNVIINDGDSYLTLKHYSMSFNSRHDFNNYPEKVVMSADFNNALLSLPTLNHFARGFHAKNIKLRLHGTAGGTVEHLRSPLLSVVMENGHTTIATSVQIDGLPDINQTIFKLNMHDLNTNSDNLAHILKGLINEQYSPSTDKIIRQLGDVQFKGELDGRYNNFIARGDAATSIGNASMDMQFYSSPGRRFTVDGYTSAKQFNIGRFLNIKLLGMVDAKAQITLTFQPDEEESFNFKLAGDVSRFDFNRYRYSGLKVDGLLTNRHFEGEVQSNDPNLMMDFKGYIAFNKGDDSTFILRHNYTADVRHANLRELHFNTRDSISELKTQLTANYQYRQSIDGGEGKIEAADVFYRDHSGVHNIGNILLLFSRGNDGYHTQLRSGFANADYAGPLPLFNFIDDIQYAVYLKRLPLLGDPTRHNTGRTSDYTLNLQFKRINKLVTIIDPELVIGDQTSIKATLTPSEDVYIHLDSPVLALGDDHLIKVKLQGETRDSLLNLQLNTNSAHLLGFDIRNISVGMNVTDNDIYTSVNFNNNSLPENKGLFHFNTSFTPNAPALPPIVNLNIYPSEITINDTTWSLAPANIIVNNRTLSFNKVSFYNQHQQIAVQGVISPIKTDTIAAIFHNFDISNFNVFSQQKGYKLEGVLSGNAHLTGVYDKPTFYADFQGDRIKVNDRPLDHIEVKSFLDNKSESVQLSTIIKEKDNTRLQLTGSYALKKDDLNLKASFQRFSLANTEPLLSGVLSDINGYLSGEVTVRGPLKAPEIHGNNVVLDNAGLTVDYLKTHYTLTAPVNITPELISIHEAEIFDGAGGKGVLSGSLKHQAFKNLNYNINITSDNLLCMNTTIKDNELFYGTAYATGVVGIQGDRSGIHFDITALTNPNTICHIPLSNASRAKESSILTFKEPVKSDDEREWTPAPKPPVDNGQHITVDINLTATPAAEAQIIFDEKAGDIIHGWGNGNIQLSIDPSINKFDLYGDYAIERGDYLFTLQNIISKKFIIEQGSHISFNGDINKTTLNIVALYKTRAPLNTLVTDTTSSVGNARRPVDCRINITGNLFNPTLKYTVEVQNLDPSTRAQVEAALNTEEKMSRQFLSLLAFNSFMPEDQSGISNIDLRASASEMLSNQLNNIFSQLNIPFDVGFIYNTGTTIDEQSNVDLAISTQLFNNRLRISAMSNTKNYNSVPNGSSTSKTGSA